MLSTTIVRPRWGKPFHITMCRTPTGAVYRKLAAHDLLYYPWSAFHPLRLSFNDLAVDLQTQDLRPTRLRRYANFDIDIRDDDAFYVTNTQSTTFQQDVDDFRNATRTFAPMLPTTTTDPKFLHVLAQVAALTKLQLRYTAAENDPDDVASVLNVSVHQVRLIAYPDTPCARPAQPPTSNAPEGIHRDGADYIVSAFVMNRHNVRGGDTVVYDNDARRDRPAGELYRTTLEPSTLFFQDDRQLWHDVTPLYAAETDPPHTWLGYRDLLGLDVHVIRGSRRRRDKVRHAHATRTFSTMSTTRAPATSLHTRAYNTRTRGLPAVDEHTPINPTRLSLHAHRHDNNTPARNNSFALSPDSHSPPRAYTSSPLTYRSLSTTSSSSTPRQPTNTRWYDRLLRVQHDDVLGATGSVSLLAAYGLTTNHLLDDHLVWIDMLNLFGSAGVSYNCWRKGAIPPMLLECAWFVLAVGSLVRNVHG